MSKTEKMDVPPTEPVAVASPKKKGKKKAQRKAPKKVATVPAVPTGTVISGKDLAPDLTGDIPGSLTEYFYWVGVIPACPVEHIDVAGINFPKVNELILPDPGRTGKTQRAPVIGALARLTEGRVKRLLARIPRTIMRFTSDKGTQEEPGTGQNLGDLHIQPRKGFLITVPTAEDVDMARAAGRATNHYVRQAHDEPAARYMFAVLCEDQEKPSRGSYYPECLETAGLNWPDKLE